MGEIFLLSSTKSIGLSKDRGLHRAKATSNRTHSVKCRRERSTPLARRREAIEATKTPFPQRGHDLFVPFDLFVPSCYRAGVRSPVRARDSIFSGSPAGFIASAAR